MRSRSCGGNLIRELMAKSTSRKTRANRSPAARRARAPRKAAAPAKTARSKTARSKVAAKAPAKGKWVYCFRNGKTYPKDLEQQVNAALVAVGRVTGRTFGDRDDPLLVSVRAGARTTMPGMMDTVLNLGLNDETVEALAEKSGDRRFAYDSYRRFITMYADVVLGVGHPLFEQIFDDHKDKNGFELDTDLSADDWVELTARYKARLEEERGEPFPQDAFDQLWGAIGAVFGSWMNQRAVTYRRLHRIPESWGTAVNVQAMVFGNMGETSATGVAFTRNPSTGEKRLYGEFLINAQGEDVVAGIRTPQEITEAA